jgi:hypothetical protein
VSDLRGNKHGEVEEEEVEGKGKKSKPMKRCQRKKLEEGEVQPTPETRMMAMLADPEPHRRRKSDDDV